MCHGHRHSRECLFSGGHGCQGVQGVRGADAPARPLLTHGTEKDGSGAPTVRDDRGWGDSIPGVKATWTIGESTKVFSYTESVIPILLSFVGAANFAQGGAAPGVWLKTKSEEMRGVSLSVMISAVLVGITEPAIYGCNLRFKWPMACAIIAGAVGGAIMGFGNVFGDAFATNGVLTIFTYASFGIAQFVFYLVGCAVAFFGAAAPTAVVGFEELTDEGMEV